MPMWLQVLLPKNAMGKENWLAFKFNSGLKRKSNRKYPDVRVGATVKFYKKKETIATEECSE